MRFSKRLAVVVAILALAVVTLRAQTTVFFSGWENAPGTGCDFTNNTDNGLWDDYGPSSTCSESPVIAQVQTAEKVSGSKGLQVHFEPGNGDNGPDFRMDVFGLGDLTESYYAWCQKWDANFKWAVGRDHKLMLAGLTGQEIYFNLRGETGSVTARPTLWVASQDAMRSDATHLVAPGAWYKFAVHARWGTGGSIEARVNDTPLVLSYEAGNNIAYSNINLEAGQRFVKIDSTYNCYRVTSPNCGTNNYFDFLTGGVASNTYYDNVTVTTGDWPSISCGGGGGGGSPKYRYRFRVGLPVLPWEWAA